MNILLGYWGCEVEDVSQLGCPPGAMRSCVCEAVGDGFAVGVRVWTGLSWGKRGGKRESAFFESSACRGCRGLVDAYLANKYMSQFISFHYVYRNEEIFGLLSSGSFLRQKSVEI